MDSLYKQFHMEYIAAAQELKSSLGGKANRKNNEALLEEVKIIVGSPSHQAYVKYSKIANRS